MPSHQRRAVFAGLTTLDVIHQVEHLPAPNAKVVALDFAVAAGGPATNAAVAFAHLGGSPELRTRLPEHPLTGLIRADLDACGVALVDAGGLDGPPVTASIMVTRATGERAVVSPSASAVMTNRSPVEPASLEGASAVLVDGYYPEIAVPLARAARAQGVPVIMDAGSLRSHTSDVIREVDVVIASQDLATPSGAIEPDDVFAWIESLGVERAAITRGSDPVLWRVRGAEGVVPIAPVAVVDTLGAGDFFHGALAWRIASLGMDDARLAEDLAWAVAAVGPALGSFGTRAWLGRE
ncbi:PfkB family carbohydrate kinase [Demequina sp. NBRC 110053]|uniref:PfkB family carbohydrate kinase n=1 Tax=Demequina sp. NBRC 110053 TaxID=1570342 RepID=UPI0009FDE9E9|nr:PfkB family carbohydrate kinase [Demequina sp. NBRC 110053]